MKKEQIQPVKIIKQLLDRTHRKLHPFAFHTVRIYMVPASENDRAIKKKLHILKKCRNVEFYFCSEFRKFNLALSHCKCLNKNKLDEGAFEKLYRRLL
jgi:hypothetical protein